MGHGAYRAAQHDPGDDLEEADDDEPDAEQDGQDGDRVDRGGRHHDPGDQAQRPEGDPPAPAFLTSARDARDQRGHALHDPGDAHVQADEREGQMQMADQDDADDDQQQAADAEPYPVRFPAAEYPDEMEDPGTDHEDAEQDGDDVERPARVEAHDEPEDQRHGAEDDRRLPRLRYEQTRCQRRVVVARFHGVLLSPSECASTIAHRRGAVITPQE